MNNTPVTFRLFSAAAAVAVTFGLLGTVTKIAEPRGGVLLAKQQQQKLLAKWQATVLVAAAR